MKNLKIAAVCMHSPWGKIDKNLRKTEVLVSEAKTAGTDIICFPELSLTGYLLKDPHSLYSKAGSDDLIKEIANLGIKSGMIILAGMIEIADSGPYISHVIAGPAGLIDIYRKTHLSPQESPLFKAGNRIDIFDSEKARFGVQLCYEAHFPEISTRMALKGAEIIFIPHASPRGNPEEKKVSWMRHLPARAFDNGLFVAAVNQIGTREGELYFPGVALILGPSGQLIEDYFGKEEKIVYGELKKEELKGVRDHRMRYFIPNRRPDIY